MNVGTKISSSVFGRASGGPVEAGRLYRINESGMEVRSSHVGHDHPRRPDERAASRGEGAGAVRVIIEEGPNFMPTIRTEAFDGRSRSKSREHRRQH